METIDKELTKIFDEIEEKLFEVKTILSTPSVIEKLEKYTDINSSQFLEIIEIYLSNLDSLKKTNNKILLKKLNEKLQDFIENSQSESSIQLYNLKLAMAFTFINNEKKNFNFDIPIQKDKFYFLDKEVDISINSMKISNFKHFKSLKIDFSKQINIVIGQNALGKTTLLQALTLGLLGENSPDEETNYSKYIKENEKESQINIYYGDKKVKEVKIFKTRRNIPNDYYRPFILAYGSNFFANYIDSDAIVQKMLNESIERDFAHTIFLEHTDKFWNPLSVLRNLEISEHPKAEDKKNIIFEVLNSFLEAEEYKLIADNKTRFYFIKKDNNQKLNLSQLSEGYRSNVLLITDMLIKILGTGREPKTVNAVVLIDEFDKHLHPRWQSRLVKKLTDTFPKIQFIMTTHNPMSILDRESNEITILKEENGEIKAIQKRVGTKKIGISTILLEYFGVETTVSKTMRDNLNDFTKLKLKDSLNKEEEQKIEKLEAFLDETVATNFIYNRSYFNFLKFLKNNKNINFEEYEELSNEDMEKLLEEYKDLFE